VEASHNSNSDLFWAIRGGGGNFGVATSFEYQLHPVAEVLAGTLEYPAGRVPELLRAYLKLSATAPDEIMLVAMIVPSQQGPRFSDSVPLLRRAGPRKSAPQTLTRVDQTAS
jgi:hypothetical protein